MNGPLGRVAGMVATLLAGSLIVFLVLNLLPGDPAMVMLGVDARPDTVAALHHQLGLDAPLAVRYLRWIGGLLSLHLGTSTTYGIPVSQLIGSRLLITLPLAAITLVLSVAIGIPVGVAAASRQGRTSDTAIMLAAQLFKAIPDFWGGVLLILVFALALHWLPSGGFPGWQQSPARALLALVLPSLALALPQAAILARFMRSSTLSALGQDFVRTARAKGLTRRAALWRHAVPNALIPVVTLIGIQFPLLLTGTIIVENVFNLPGLGRLLYEAINQRDLIVVQDLVVMLVSTVLLVNFAVDLVSLRLDPRLGSGTARA
ncbi:ABC transporter permease [Lichenicola sp.]|uniref:ABC transporter permease n=1 Tax=Lichenicola sp. TaxID=2804529 RepID=UPI003B00F2A6